MNIDTELTVFFVGYYNKTKIIPDSVVAKEILLKKYQQFLNEGILTPIENITQEEKINLVNECRSMKDKNYTNKTLKEQSIVLYLILFLNFNS